MTKATEKLARLKATPGASTYVKPQAMEWQTTQFEKIWIKVLYDNAEKGEMTCLLRLEPGRMSHSTSIPSSSKSSSSKSRCMTMTG